MRDQLSNMMTPFLWIPLSGILMSCIALVGSLPLITSREMLNKLLLPLVAFAAGSLIGGALFHMVPSAHSSMPSFTAFVWGSVGGWVFFAIEQFLHRHHFFGALAVFGGR